MVTMETGTALTALTLIIGVGGTLIKVLRGIDVTLSKVNTTINVILQDQEDTTAHIEALRHEQEEQGKEIVSIKTKCAVLHERRGK